MEEILELLKSNARLSAEEIAQQLGLDVEQVQGAIDEFESQNTIMGYSAVVNWEDTTVPKVFAIIQIQASPEHGTGFDKIAMDIARFDEVHSVYLISGTFDLQAIVEGDDLREVARFVSEKLAPTPGVTGTSTSFVLKTYKLEGKLIEEHGTDERLAVSP